MARWGSTGRPQWRSAGRALGRRAARLGDSAVKGWRGPSVRLAAQATAALVSVTATAALAVNAWWHPGILGPAGVLIRLH